MSRKIENFLLSLLIFLIPSQLAVHIWPSWSSVSGVKVDYFAPAFYFVDFIILILGRNIKIKFNSQFLLVLLFSVSNILFSINPLLTVFNFSKIFILYLFFLYIKQNSYTFISLFKKLFPGVLSFYALIGLAQFALQRHLGSLFYFLGERPLIFYMANIAKIQLPFLGLTLRSYSTFPHPNAFAGFLLLSLVVLGMFKTKSRFFILPLLALVTTFSRSAFLGLILGGIFKLWSFILIPFFFIGSSDSLTGRLTLLKNSIVIIFNHPLFGIGYGNYSFLSNLNYQPVHNIFLLLVSELGVLFFAFLGLLIFRYLKQNFSLSFVSLYSIVIITGSVDHYWITSHQNTILLIILLFLFWFNTHERLT